MNCKLSFIFIFLRNYAQNGSFVLFLGVLFFSAIFTNLLAEEKYKIEPYSVQVIIDGKPKDKIWRQLPYSNLFVSKDEKVKLDYSTRFKAFSDKENLYLLVELKGQSLADIPLDPKTGKENLAKNSLSLLIAPRAEQDDHYKIELGFHGAIEDSFVPAMAGHGYPYSPVENKEWNSEIKYALAEEQGVLYFEIQLPVKPMNLESQTFGHFGLNILNRIEFAQELTNKSLKIICQQRGCFFKIRP